MDGFGNARGSVSIQVVAPGELARLRIEVADTTFEADGKTAVPVTVRVEDRSGVPVTARTPLSRSAPATERCAANDLDPVEPGLQIFVEEGRAEVALVAPSEPGDVRVRAVSGVLEGGAARCASCRICGRWSASASSTR